MQNISPKIKKTPTPAIKKSIFSRRGFLPMVATTSETPFRCRKSCKIIITPQIGFHKEHMSLRLYQEENKQFMRENCLPEEN